MNINWFPGHMAKTKRLLSENLKLVDVVIELLDARIPFSSKNPDISGLIAGKQHLIVLNKSDLADDTISNRWKNEYKSQGKECIFVDTLKGKGLNDVKVTLRAMLKEKLAHARAKGRINRPIRTMVVGIPNVGKSSFINKIAGRSIAITGDKPGVTRAKQWIRINEEFELLDTPGVLWPKFDDENVAINLASTGAIKDTVFDIAEVCAKLLEKLSTHYSKNIAERYKINNIEEIITLTTNSENEEIEPLGFQLLKTASKNRGYLISGGEIDIYRGSAIILDEFRAGKIGRISLDRP